MDGKRLIEKIRLRNLLSFGPETEEFELEPLNVLIGANASGKSNLIEAISLLQAAPRDLLLPFREGGGVAEWLWKGGAGLTATELRVVVRSAPGRDGLEYRLGFARLAQRLKIDERVEGENARSGVDLRPDESVLSQRLDPDRYPGIKYLAARFEEIRLY